MSAPHPDGVTLNDVVDGLLSAVERDDIRRHLTGCDDCRSLFESLREVKSSAGALPPVQPPREAWDRIERRLRTEPSRRRVPQWAWLAAAASMLLVVFLGYRQMTILRRQTSIAQAAASTDQAENAATAQFVEAELRQAEDHYQKAIAAVEQQISTSDKASLDPQTAATLAKNLSVIDQAISESRAALRAQPTSEPAQASLLESFKAKIALLQDTVALINEMRKGPSAQQKGT